MNEERKARILFETRKKLKLAAVDKLRLEKTFTDVEVSFPGGMKVIQFRNEFDRANLISVASAAIALAVIGKPNDAMVYQTKDNKKQDLKASEMLSVAMEVLAKKQTVVSAAWVHKAAIRDLTTLEAVEAYDITKGWPE